MGEGEIQPMILLKKPPSLSMVHDFIGKVKKYPVTAGELVEMARRMGAPQEIIDLYSIFARDAVFPNKDDLTSRSEVIAILESQEEPEEQLVAPEEY